MSRWFRFHSDAIRNPKVARLSDKQYRLWTELMAVAAENDGHIPPLNDLRYALNRRLDHLSTGVDQLISGGLIVVLADGYEPHNWSKHQYKSDSSKDRVAKHRASGNVTVTPPDTDTDTDTERKKEKTPLPPQAGKNDFYAFVGKVVRLNEADLSNWQRRFSSIPDFQSELRAVDDWLSDQPDAKKTKWFSTASSWLNRKHQEFLRMDTGDDEVRFTGPC